MQTNTELRIRSTDISIHIAQQTHSNPAEPLRLLWRERDTGVAEESDDRTEGGSGGTGVLERWDFVGGGG